MKKLLFIGIGVLVLSACNNNNQDNGKEQSVNDNRAADTATATATATSNYDAALALLNDIPVDRAMFKHIYTNCRVKSDEFNGKFLYDSSSPQTANSNGVFAYIDETNLGLRFAIQYQAAQKLAVKSATFTIDGQTYAYPTQFKPNTTNLELSDQEVTNAQLALLVKMALGKTVTLNLTGAQGQETITLTAQQQQALQNMLILYKGMLMGYNS